jgi:hypothetical protein
MQELNNFSRFRELRRAYPVFSYDSYDIQFTGAALDIRFHFTLADGIKFTPSARIPWKKDIYRPFHSIPPEIIEQIVFNMGMIELISYWKAACPPRVVVKAGALSPAQADFWKKLYFFGLGEFFYVNGIQADTGDFMNILSDGRSMAAPVHFETVPKPIVPVGGGKDSAVTMEFLTAGNFDWIPMVINPREATNRVILAAGKTPGETMVVHRQIDPGLLRLNEQGYLNGHTPFSALLAFYSLLLACLSGRAEIVLSNESSANEPTIPGTNINHQYSKSVDFEKDFRNYCKNHISPAFDYFSFLRPLSELQIAGLFAKTPQYFPHFKSCNVGSKTDTWCGACPKCLFTYIILSPFLSPDELVSIFGRDLLEDTALKPILDELTGRAGIKPFECIGTVDEVNAALRETLMKSGREKVPALLRMWAAENTTDPAPINTALAAWNADHCLPEKYLNLHGSRGQR